MERALGRSPTFLVGTENQRHNLNKLQRREQHLAEQYQKNKPLCFSAGAYQKTHPLKAVAGHRDADATGISPMLLGVADGVSQIEEFGMDASELPNELLAACEELAMAQLIPDGYGSLDAYRGPIPLMREAFEATESFGSTTICLAILDNSTRIHGKLHPMIAVLSVGDCELLILRQLNGSENPFEIVFHTEMQRIDGNAQCPLQVARLDDRVDPDFDEQIAIEVIERGSAVHCVSVYEGDIVIGGSDGVFDNLFLDEVVDICNEAMSPKPGNFVPTQPAILSKIAKRIVEESHAKSQAMHGLLPDTPIGRGGKMDDTSVVVGEVVEWTQAHSEVWSQVLQKRQRWNNLSCGMDTLACRTCRASDDSGDEHEVDLRRNSSRESGGPYKRSANESMVSDDEDEGRCSIQ